MKSHKITLHLLPEQVKLVETAYQQYLSYIKKDNERTISKEDLMTKTLMLSFLHMIKLIDKKLYTENDNKKAEVLESTSA